MSAKRPVEDSNGGVAAATLAAGGASALVKVATHLVSQVLFPILAASVLLWSVIIGPNSAAAMSAAVDAAATKISLAVKEAGGEQVHALREEVSRIDTTATSRTDSAVRQLQADIGKVREDCTRIREAITVIQLEFERSKKQ